jgi:hypothetical protein
LNRILNVRRILRLLALPMLAFLSASIPARAQALSDKVEVFGGYSYFHLDSSPSTSLNGWELSGQYKFARWLGGVADFGGDYGSIGGVGTSVHTFLFGPQVSFPGRVSPFAHVLIGGAHFSAGGGSDTAFATALGFGIDYRLEHGLSWRVIQGEYLITRFGSSTQNNARLSTGIVFRF